MGVVANFLALEAGCSSGADGSGGASSTSSTHVTSTTGVPCGDTACDPAKEYCGFEPGKCDGPKACHAYGYDCTNLDATCGCDGVSYPGACHTLDAVGGIRSGGACPAPPGKFNCTYQTQVPILCDPTTQYCQATFAPSEYALECKPFTNCGAGGSSCACSDPGFQRCSQNFCAQDAKSGGVTVLCMQ